MIPSNPAVALRKVHMERAYLVFSRIDRVLRYCHHIVMDRLAMAGQQECPKLANVPVILCLCRLVPETIEQRSNIPPGMPEETMASAVPRSFRSGRCPSYDFSARADTARIRVSTPMMRVKVARFLLCGAIFRISCSRR